MERLRRAALALAVALGCDAPEPPSEVDALALEVEAHAGDNRGVAAALRYARLAEAGGADASRAVALLERVGRDGPRGCEVRLAEVRLARARGDLVGARELLEPLRRAAPAACAGESERLGAELLPATGLVERIAAFGAGGAGVRAVLTLGEGSDPVALARGARHGPGVVVFDGLGAGPLVPRDFPVGRGGLRRVLHGPSELRLELEAGAEATVLALASPARLLVDVVAARPDAAPGEGPLVVLDPGHGGEDDRGSWNGRLHEADLVLDLAQRTSQALGRVAPSVRVLLTRTEDRPVDLEARTALANAAGADLFVSLHLNGSREEVRRGGVTTFVLDASSDRAARRLAARENGTRPYEVTQLQHLLAGFHRREQVAASRALADAVHQETLRAGRRLLPTLADRGIKSATFFVLVGARMPAVLLEASFLTQDDEAAALARPAYREALAQGIAAGIVRALSQLGGV